MRNFVLNFKPYPQLLKILSFQKYFDYWVFKPQYTPLTCGSENRGKKVEWCHRSTHFCEILVRVELFWFEFCFLFEFSWVQIKCVFGSGSRLGLISQNWNPNLIKTNFFRFVFKCSVLSVSSCDRFFLGWVGFLGFRFWFFQFFQFVFRFGPDIPELKSKPVED